MKATTYQGKPCKRGHIGIRRVKGGDCVDCVKERARERWNTNPEHRDKWLQKRREIYATEGGKEYRREHNLKAHYGMTQLEYDQMLQTQNYSCAICDIEQWQTGKNFHVDHDHNTGDVRALLCGNCNRGLGAFLDSPAIVELAASYLRKHGRV